MSAAFKAAVYDRIWPEMDVVAKVNNKKHRQKEIWYFLCNPASGDSYC